MDIIDLETFKKKMITLRANGISSYCASCYLGNFTYFINGGFCPAIGTTQLINLKTCNVTSLPDSCQRLLSGACLYNNKIYIFGGSPNGILQSSLCQQFD
jgi:hypothetical protein